MYAIIDKNNKFVRWIDGLREEFSSTSFPMIITQKDLPSGVVIVETPNPPEVAAGQLAERKAEPVFDNGVWKLDYSTRAMTEAELATVNTAKSQDARVMRDSLLQSSDWTQVADAPVNKQAWATYRQELRDITQQAGFPANITWPIKPV